ncbi:MAG TPA: hypothetical protein VJN89_11630 [Candidatus Acidoferrum sp.]|nr:hypothetical protein [Candidatus Acidoferrum sp.]
MLKCKASILFLFVFALAAKAEDKNPIPAVIKSATYVYVTTYYGDVFSPEVMPDDRHAVQNVQSAIEKWGRYKLVYNRGEADLLLVVRAGRLAEVKGGVQVSTTTQRVGDTTSRVHGSAESIGGEVGDPHDTLEVYMASQGINGPPMWRGRALDGLKAPEMRLVQELRSKVEAPEKKRKKP